MPWAAAALVAAGAWLGASSLSWFTDSETTEGFGWEALAFVASSLVGAAIMAYLLYGFILKPLIGAR